MSKPKIRLKPTRVSKREIEIREYVRPVVERLAKQQEKYCITVLDK